MHSQNEKNFYPEKFDKKKGQCITSIVWSFVFYDNSRGHNLYFVTSIVFFMTIL